MGDAFITFQKYVHLDKTCPTVATVNIVMQMGEISQGLTPSRRATGK